MNYVLTTLNVKYDDIVGSKLSPPPFQNLLSALTHIKKFLPRWFAQADHQKYQTEIKYLFYILYNLQQHRSDKLWQSR